MLISAFTLEQVARLTGLSEHQLRYWDETGFFRPSYRDEKQRPYGRVYSFRDVAELRVLALLRREHQVSLQQLRRVGEFLKNQADESWTTVSFYVAGKHVYFRDPREGVIREGGRPEQTVIPIEMSAVVAATDRDAAELRQRESDEVGKVVQHRYTSHNAPLIAGTRVRTEAIWRFHQAGYSTDEIIQEYPRLTSDDVQAAIAYEEKRHRAAS